MPKTHLQSLIATTLATGLLGVAGAAHAINPYAQPDEAWISMSGTVDSVSADTFTLDYGDGSIFVEMDDGDRDGDAYKLIPGDKVTVTGRVDDDLFESTSIEASSVYLEKLGTTFHASAADEEDLFIAVTAPIVISQTTVVCHPDTARFGCPLDSRLSGKNGGFHRPVTAGDDLGRFRGNQSIR